MVKSKSIALSRALLKIDGRAVEVTVRLNPRARRLIVKVNSSTGEITVVAPSQRAMTHALDFARGESDWIKKKLARVPPRVALELDAIVPFRGRPHRIVSAEKGPAPVWIDATEPLIYVSGRAEHAQRRVCDFFKKEARARLAERTAHFAAELKVKPRRLAIRDTASRWGSCSASRSLSFSWRLILAPDPVLDYVVAHEVAHMIELNHGTRFWRLVGQLLPGYKDAQTWLARNGTNLHRYDLR
jgi:predicted metal-dependent hydrolase